MASGADTSLSTIARSGLVLAGLLLLGVGVGNALAGHSKIAQYEDLLRSIPPPPPPDPTTLFPKKSDAEERLELVRAKLAFYQLLVSVGQLASAVGFALVAAGVLRLLRVRSARAAP
jgi:hypothetical protein